MEAHQRPDLRVIDGRTGEIQNVCEHCVAKDQAIERLTRSYEGTIQRLRQELDDKRQDEKMLQPLALGVVEDWCRRAHESGWWTRRPTPTEPRIAATVTSMNRGHEAGYLMMVNTGAFIGAATERKNPKFKRAFLEPSTIYGKHIDSHFQTAIDPANERVRQLLEAPKALRDRWLEVLDLADPCDCGHLRLDHHKPTLVEDVLTGGGCGVHGCDCMGFDDLWVRVDGWMDRHGRGRG